MLEWLQVLLRPVWIAASAWQFWIGAVLLTSILWFLKRRFKTTSVSLGLPFGMGSVTFDTTSAERVVAWKLYVQLVTRKAALPFDIKHDLVVETFDSLYEIFGVARALLSETPPADKVVRDGVASVVIGVLNSGVRPLLTRWHADFRRWWDRALADSANENRRPQEIQRDYPDYDQLVYDLERTNTELSKFADELLEIAAGRTERRPRAIVRPSPPTLNESH